MEALSSLEEAALTALLIGSDPRLAVLRAQLAGARVLKREFTGVGFYCDLAVPHAALGLGKKVELIVMGVDAEIEGLEHGAGFLLWVSNGRLDSLECFTYDEPWPAKLGSFNLRTNEIRIEDRNAQP